MSLTRHEKRILIAASILVGLAAVAVAAITVTIHQSGMIVVNVKERGPHGDDISIRIPGAAAAMALRFMPEDLFCDVARGSSDCAALIRAFSSGLCDMPDCELINVTSRSEKVKILKRQGHIVVDVESPEERAFISLPLSLVSTFAKRIERAQRRAEVS